MTKTEVARQIPVGMTEPQDVGAARDPELSGLLARGDLRSAGQWLVERYARDVVGLCRAMVRERHLAEDLAQDTFSNALVELGGFRQDASARTWLLTIARNQCIDHIRRTKRAPLQEWGDDGFEPDEHADPAPLAVERFLDQREIQLALDTLAESERALVVLRFRHGLDYPELANVFGVKQGTVRMRLSRALGRMRNQLEALQAPEEAAFGAPPPRQAEEALAERGRATTGARPRTAALPPAAAAPPPAPGAAPPPPPPAAPAMAGAPLPRVSAPKRKSRSLWQSLSDWLRGRRDEPVEAALDEDVPSLALRQRLDALVAKLPR